MKKLTFSAFVLLLINALSWTACHNPNSRQKPQAKDYAPVSRDSKAGKSDTVCYLSINQGDSTHLALYINKGDVSGRMAWMPTGKDSRRGTIAGSKQDSLINAVWVYTQEGKRDTMNIQFKIAGDKVYQQPLKESATGGKLEVNKTQPWSVVYNEADCTTGK